jgi:hypothetical protein
MAAVLVAVVLAMSGCGKTGRAHDKVAMDRQSPFSLFQGEEIGLVDYVQLKLRNQCLAKAGYPQDLNVMLATPRNPFDNLIISARTFGPTTEQEARRIGFGSDQAAAPPTVVSFDPNYDESTRTCSKQAWGRLGAEAERVYFGYYDLGNKLAGPLMPMIEQRLDPQFSSRLMACITGKGYRVSDTQAFLKTPDPHLLGVPFGTLDSGVGASWKPKGVPGTIEIGPTTPAQQYQASPEEGALAVAWLDCRQETKLTEQQVTIATAVQLELVTKYEDTFVELNPQVERLARQAAALIGRP